MSLWFLLWFVLSFILLGATFWSTIILLQQKKSWSRYAAKKDLIFTRGTFFGSASVEGTINGYEISLFSATQQRADARQNRQLTVLQVTADHSFIDAVACGTNEMLPFIKSLESVSHHEIKTKSWNKKHYVMSRHKKAIDEYLTEERVKVLGSVLGMPNADILVLLDGNGGVIRIETANPLQDAAKLEKIVNNIMAGFQKLRPSEDEAARLKGLFDSDAISASVSPRMQDVSADTGLLGDIGLELEPDPDESVEEKVKQDKPSTTPSGEEAP